MAVCVACLDMTYRTRLPTTSHRYELRHVVVSGPKTRHDMDLILDNRGRGETTVYQKRQTR
jgi:hypothetical protein